MGDIMPGEMRATRLYTPEQKNRRDKSKWTMVQAILAPIQFVVCFISIFLVLRYLIRGVGYDLATVSIIIKTLVLYLIMFTGAIWEKEVFGQYLLAPAFFWEDVVSFFVIALHTTYLIALMSGLLTSEGQMWLALVAYTVYIINAVQFLLKLRSGRTEVIVAEQVEGEVVT
ncbi:MAG: 2-vinyl bacteriochlorophyllide hydratase [Rhodobacteraceae bacterium]|nr:MAG: 2-vinyl bacteriochlorophyllide hydratase [Paracoccaceae bacterium]